MKTAQHEACTFKVPDGQEICLWGHCVRGLQTDQMHLDRMEDLREQLMAERLIPYNIDVRYVPGKQMEAPDLA